MGIRDLFLFNQALLAIQRRKLLTQPHSLVAQYFKSIYFPNTSFLEASKCIIKSSIIVWSSLPWGQKLLHFGIGWRVRNGNSISIWHSNWPQDKTMFKPLPIFNSPQAPQFVDQLIQHNHGIWSWNHVS